MAVKLGSITAEGSADVYCYKCNEERVDPELATHLAHWGIYLAGREKTEKSLMEMQVEHNLKWEFSMTTEDGRELTPGLWACIHRPSKSWKQLLSLQYHAMHIFCGWIS